jgi:hypothetical protein
VRRHNGDLRTDHPAGSKRINEHATAIAISVTDKIFSLANSGIPPSELKKTQELQLASATSIWVNQGKAISPATNPKQYPNRGRKAITIQAHTNTNGQAAAATSTGWSQLGIPQIVRNMHAMLTAALRNSAAAVSVGMTSGCVSRDISILNWTPKAARQFRYL